MRSPSPHAPCTSTLVVTALLAIAGCGEAPAPRGTDTPSSAAGPTARSATVATSSSAASVPATGAPTTAAPGASAVTDGAPAGSASSPVASIVPPAAIDLAAAPKLVDVDGKPLPQTDDRPSTSSPAFKRRMELLWQAIVEDDPSIATEAVFFPRVAYAQVKDIPKPEADWKSRLVKAFERNVHEYHRKLGDDPKAAKLVAVEVDEKRVKVMERGKEGNKLPYHRVTRSKIRWVDGAGKEKTLELTSLIAWRGEWFVVHLNGFK